MFVKNNPKICSSNSVMDFHWSKGLGTQDCSLVLCISKWMSVLMWFYRDGQMLFGSSQIMLENMIIRFSLYNSSAAFITSEQTKYWLIVTFIFTQTGDNLIYNAEMNAEQKHLQMFVADCISMCVCVCERVHCHMTHAAVVTCVI